MREKYYSIGTIIIDDIRLPDGTDKIGVLGGGLTHAVMGMRIWKEPVTGGWYGAVSVSFALQQFGTLFPLDGIEKEAGDRLRWYQQADRIKRSIKQDELNEF